MRSALKISPLTTMMAIRDCYGGHLKGAGTALTGEMLESNCPEPGICYDSNGKLITFKTCGDSE